MSWKLAWFLRSLMMLGVQQRLSRIQIDRTRTYSTRLAASASIFSVSSAFVGSSNARIPQFWPNESESARRMMIDANIFWPAEQRPRMSISTWSFVITTWRCQVRRLKGSNKIINPLDNCMSVLKRRLRHLNVSWYRQYLASESRIRDIEKVINLHVPVPW